MSELGASFGTQQAHILTLSFLRKCSCLGESRAAHISGSPSKRTTPFPVDKRRVTRIQGLSKVDISIIGYVLQLWWLKTPMIEAFPPKALLDWKNFKHINIFMNFITLTIIDTFYMWFCSFPTPLLGHSNKKQVWVFPVLSPSIAFPSSAAHGGCTASRPEPSAARATSSPASEIQPWISRGRTLQITKTRCFWRKKWPPGKSVMVLFEINSMGEDEKWYLTAPKCIWFLISIYSLW